MGGSMKLIGIDLDGTLLNSQKEISKENIEALKSIANNDQYYVFICSGRPAFNIKNILDKYDLDLPFVGTNGALAYDGDKIIFDFPFDKQVSINVYETIKDHAFLAYNKSERYGEKCHLEKLEKLFKISEDYLTEDELNSFKNYRKGIIKDNLREFDDFYELLDKEDFQIFKFFMYMPILERKQKIQEQLSKVDGIYTTESERTNIEIVAKNVNKGMVFKHLEKYLNLEKSTRIAIGDSLNDLEMFKMADYSFAMENAYDEIKDIATHVVTTNDKNGVAEAIEIIKRL